jgi:hypothetical protein
MKYSAKQIAKFIEENVSLTRNELIQIWEGPNGLTYTRGSMDYRDNKHVLVLSFLTMDEVPEGEELIDSIEFYLNQQIND